MSCTQHDSAESAPAMRLYLLMQSVARRKNGFSPLEIVRFRPFWAGFFFSSFFGRPREAKGQTWCLPCISRTDFRLWFESPIVRDTMLNAPSRGTDATEPISEASTDLAIPIRESTRIDPVDEDHFEMEANTESVQSFPKRRWRRLILNFAREQEEPVDSGGEGLEPSARLNRVEESADIVFVPHARATAVGLQSLDEVDLTQVFEVPALVMKSIPKFMRGAFRGALNLSLPGDSTRLCGEQQHCGSAWVEVVLPLTKVTPLPATSWRSDSQRQIARTSGPVCCRRWGVSFVVVFGNVDAGGHRQ